MSIKLTTKATNDVTIIPIGYPDYKNRFHIISTPYTFLSDGYLQNDINIRMGVGSPEIAYEVNIYVDGQRINRINTHKPFELYSSLYFVRKGQILTFSTNDGTWAYPLNYFYPLYIKPSE